MTDRMGIGRDEVNRSLLQRELGGSLRRRAEEPREAADRCLQEDVTVHKTTPALRVLLNADVPRRMGEHGRKPATCRAKNAESTCGG